MASNSLSNYWTKQQIKGAAGFVFLVAINRD